jgi:hypothetical protein
MNNWKPLKSSRRIFVFTVPHRGKTGSGLLYQPQTNRGSLSDIGIKAWVLDPAGGCETKWKRGQTIYLHDGFELSDIDLNLWDAHKDAPEFASLREFVDKYEGIVSTNVITESSIIGFED